MDNINITDINNIVDKIKESVIFFSNFETTELIEILKVSNIKKVNLQ